MTPKLTVVTPSFNQGRFIERTIRSVLDQGYPNLEYVILDGGSTDETLDVIARYEDQLAWWVSEPDSGQTAAINRGIQRTDGEIVAYLNSDDYYLPGALERVVAAFRQTDCGWVAGAALDLDEQDRPAGTPGTDRDGVIRPTPPEQWEWGWPKGKQWWLLAPWHVPQPSAFWRRNLFEGHGLFRADMHYAFDAEFMIRLALAKTLPEFLDGAPLAVRVHHEAAKSADFSRWRPEIEQIVRIHSPSLTTREIRRLPFTRLLFAPGAARTSVMVSRFAWLPLRLAWIPATAMARTVWFAAAAHRAFHRCLSRVGDLLDHVPERWRPPIRTRDRRARAAAREAGRTEAPRYLSRRG